jgi:predicted N-acetyltransferase YhbS
MSLKKQILIRREQPEDYSAVERLTREAFWNLNVPGCDEHYLAHTLRSHPDFLPELDFVAVIDDIVAGNIMFARSVVADNAGNNHPVLTFGPLSVLPAFQKQGIGASLVRHSCDKARALGHPAVLIYGDPAYYSRIGFRPAENFGIATGEGSFHPALQALELLPGVLSALRGRFLEGPAYHFDPAQAAEFDARFPPKEKFVTESQRRFARLAGLPVPD